MENDKEPKSILDRLNRRIISTKKKSFQFKNEYKPGLIKYFTIELGKKYKINSSTKRISGSVFEVTGFIYNKDDNQEVDTPLGVEVKFMKNNQTGTYYDLYELEEVTEI
jgi:hypothetical protein